MLFAGGEAQPFELGVVSERGHPSRERIGSHVRYALRFAGIGHEGLNAKTCVPSGEETVRGSTIGLAISIARN